MAWFTGKGPTPRTPPKGTDIRRLHLRYEGECQGVGFRWNSRECALKDHLTGWVRNLVDGTVEMELQGADEDISRFFTDLDRSYERWDVSFNLADSREVEPISGETDFSVRF